MNVYAEFIDFIVATIKPELIAEFKASEETHDYFYSLLNKEKAGLASDEERKKLDQFLQLEHILRMTKIKARQYVKQ
jgi:hypothetical protein